MAALRADDPYGSIEGSLPPRYYIYPLRKDVALPLRQRPCFHFLGEFAVMTDENKKYNPFYHPDLHPDLDYYSQGGFIHTQPDLDTIIDIPEETTPSNDPKQLKEDLQEVADIMLSSVPISIAEPVNNIIKKLVDRLNIAFPSNYYVEDPPKKEYIAPEIITDNVNHIVEIPENTSSGIVNMPNLFPSAPNINLILEVPKTLVQIIQEDYQRDMIRLKEYYLQQLQMILQQYFNQMLTILAGIGLDSIDTITKDIDGESLIIPPNQSLEHCRDHLIRSQVRRKQRANLFRNCLLYTSDAADEVQLV